METSLHPTTVAAVTKCPNCKTKTDCTIAPGKFVKFISPVLHLHRLWCPGCGKKFYVRG